MLDIGIWPAVETQVVGGAERGWRGLGVATPLRPLRITSSTGITRRDNPGMGSSAVGL